MRNHRLSHALLRFGKSTTAQVFIVFLAIYVVTAPGGYEIADAVLRYETAKSWLDGRGGALTATIAPNGAVAPDGRIYSFYGPFQSLLMVPIILLARAFSNGSPDTLVKLIFGIAVLPSVSALSMAILFRALSSIGYSRRIALWTTIVIGLATPMWHYARSGQEENIVGLGFSIYLWGISRLFRNRFDGLILIALAESMILATRWSHAVTMVVLLLPVATLLWKDRANVRAWWRYSAVAAGLLSATTCVVLWYNYHRFSNPFETGYGLFFRRSHQPFIILSRIPANAVALLVSPLRGIFWFCPAILILLGLRTARRSQLAVLLSPYIVVAWIFTLFLSASLSFWTAGFAWGPRYFIGLIVLLAPFFAAVFASGQRWRWVIAISTIVQLCSVVLPSSAENVIYSMKNAASPGTCSPWSCDCTAVCLRLPWSLRAIANTMLGRPLPIIDSDGPGSPNDSQILASSDYESVYWWPIRAAYRAHKLSPPLALVFCLSVLLAAAYAFYAMLRAQSSVNTSST